MDCTINSIVKKYTAFSDLFDMINTHKSYRPSLNTKGVSKQHTALRRLANKYDRIMEAIGDSRRAYRY